MKLAIIRVRGTTGIKQEIAYTLSLLHLNAKNNCVVVEDTPVLRGMLRKIQGYVTYGTVDDDTLKAMEVRNKGKFFSLAPPRKGFGRKGIKVPFSRSGGLGDRKDKINDLINRMVA
ncbi:MAG: large subunit ribosomal protein L30 [Candidatus Woesearchaeota archaeon]|jgi:large subunit ribosomal protein L30